MTAAVQSKERVALRLFNGASRALAALGRTKPKFSEMEEPMHAAAVKAVGASDFGDPAYRKALGVLLESYDRESKLTPFGRMMVEQQLGAILRNRLRASWRTSGKGWHTYGRLRSCAGLYWST